MRLSYLRRHPQKQRGQIVILMMFAMIPLMLLMAYLYNGGYLMAQKIKLQNATDTAVLMEASWTARTLNVMSMNNTAMTQSQAITSMAFALEKPLLDAGLNSGLVAGFYAGRAFRIAVTCPPLCTVIAPIVYTIMYGFLNKNVLIPLQNLHLEQKRALHRQSDGQGNDQGFSKAAASFGRMNQILQDKFPAKIQAYSEALTEVNYDDAIETHRYTAWAEPQNTHLTQIPVVKQSFSEALAGIRQQTTVDSLTGNEVDNSTAEKLNAALVKIKDIRDVEVAGLLGTHKNPYNAPSFNYFGNFKAQGYPEGTGPFALGRVNAEAEFDAMFTTLGSYIDGRFLAKELKKIKRELSSAFGGGFIGDFVADIVIEIFDTIIAPLLATTYEDQATNQEDLKQRLDEVWQWSARYGESNYSNAYDLSGEKRIAGLFTLAAPPRMVRGIVPGIYHGQQLTNVFENAMDSLKKRGENLEEDFMEKCIDRYLPARIEKLESEKLLEKSKSYETEKREAERNGTEPPIKETMVVLTSAEKIIIGDTAKTEITKECEEKYKKTFGSVVNSVDINESNNDKDENKSNNSDESSTDNTSGGSGSIINDPKKAQDALEFVNWLFQPSYRFMKLKFPFDGSLIGAIGTDRPARDPKVCSEVRLVEGFICTNETPMYAVRGQRLIPEYFAEKVNDFIGPSFDNAFKDTYTADRRDWSLLMALSAPTKLRIAPGGFGRVPPIMSTIAQAEVYNAQWFDLFTQSWKAKLTPVTLLQDENHIKEITNKWSDDEDTRLVDLFSLVVDEKSRILNH